MRWWDIIPRWSSKLQRVYKTYLQKTKVEKRFGVSRNHICLFFLKLIFFSKLICKITRTYLGSAVFANKIDLHSERRGGR